MKILVDTNILARLAQPEHEHHGLARDSVSRLRDRSNDLSIVPQVLYEFWVVATRPKANSGLGLAHSRASADIDGFKRLFRFLRDERGIYPNWEKIVMQARVSGKPSHDARLVAAMRRHKLDHILTFNGKDFKRYSEITVIEPRSIK